MKSGSNHSLTEKFLIGSEHDYIAAQNPSTPSETLEFLGKKACNAARFYVVRNPNAPQGIWIPLQGLVRIFP